MQRKYQGIVFLQNDEATEALDILSDLGEAAAMEYLSQWDFGDDDGEITDYPPWGSGDTTFKLGDYFMSYHLGLGYIGLCRRV